MGSRVSCASCFTCSRALHASRYTWFCASSALVPTFSHVLCLSRSCPLRNAYPTGSCVSRASWSMCSRASRALCTTCLVHYMLLCPTYLVPCVPSILRAILRHLTCFLRSLLFYTTLPLYALVHHVPLALCVAVSPHASCLTCLVSYVPLYFMELFCLTYP